MDTVINSITNANISKKHEKRFFLLKLKSLLYSGFKFPTCIYVEGCYTRSEIRILQKFERKIGF